MLIPSLYATSPRARSLRPVRVPSDQNTRWRLPHHFSLLRDNEFLVSPYWLDIYPPIPHYLHFLGWMIAATSRTCDSSDDEFDALFETPPPRLKRHQVFWQFRMENWLTHIEIDVHHIRDTQVHIVANQENMDDDLHNIKTMMANLLSRYPPPWMHSYKTWPGSYPSKMTTSWVW